MCQTQTFVIYFYHPQSEVVLKHSWFLSGLTWQLIKKFYCLVTDFFHSRFAVDFNPAKSRQSAEAISHTADKSRATLYQCYEFRCRALRDAVERAERFDFDERSSDVVPEHRWASATVRGYFGAIVAERPRSTNTFRLARLSLQIDGDMRRLQKVL